ncbi:ABC transporter ATP-binding protein [Roseivivax isoporae]|uniref:Peptide ABC transporter ATP-binding protein n=1 Tax=Roseivivax isoporae LMG 25204 TaxID=1449351 RepID=X7FAZ9_9RHOB|nr:ABC transporter ATP-binding protein [Roseivivax isoporae]ETX29898.1 peptide ABC transporter ATP-binding protein [Roseivivax isoporae LMG 25204]
MSPLLAIEDLTVEIRGAPVVDGVSLSIAAGETLALVGESGCGKSMTAMAILGLAPEAAAPRAARATLDGHAIDPARPDRMDGLRGRVVSTIFQEPVLSLDPTMRIGAQVMEALRLHDPMPRAAAAERVAAMLADVGIPDPRLRMRQYPHELSGGMCQRVMIAMALITRPRLLIADEPTTALDVTTQAQILDLIARLRDETGTAVLLITHDMGVVAEVADRVAVMYAGRIVEQAPAATLFARQRHPYTALLLRTIPRLDGPRKTALPAIPGAVPAPADWPQGCRFAPRCPLAIDTCRAESPPFAEVAPGHAAACWRSEEVT